MTPALARALPDLRHRYADPHRVYHTEAHIEAMLRGMAANAAHITHPDAVELAIWYHDAIYDPAATDNEARSAALLRAEPGAADLATMDLATAMIEASAHHTLPPDLPAAWRDDMALFLDLDMEVLGAEPARYDAYEAGIAAEYVPVHGPHAFRRGRAAFLHATLARDRLFLTDRFHVAFDGKARQNMTRALAALNSNPSRS